VFGFLDSLKLSRKLALISVIYAVGLVASVAYTVVALRAQENAGIVIGNAGALGRWNEQLLKEIFLAADGMPSDYAATAERFFATLDSLAGERVALAPADAARLRQASELTHGFMERADVFLRTSPRAPEYEVHRREMLEANRHAVELIDQVVRDLGEQSRASLVSLAVVVLAIGALAWTAAAVLGTLVGRSILQPVGAGVELLEEIAAGDLRRRARSSDRGDELGTLLRAAERMSEGLRSLTGELGETLRELHAGAQKLAPSADALNDAARGLRERGKTMAAASGASATAINEIAAAAERCAPRIREAADGGGVLAANMLQASEAVEELTASVRSISSSIEEMTQSLSEVSRSADNAAKVTSDVDALTRESRSTVVELEKAAQNISGVAGTIHDIAEQTTLLALNATIEAASAGAAGKGFAVVAEEVKNLAQQTTQATSEIEARIEAMRQAALASIRATERITASIEGVTTATGEISRSVSEQTAASAQISANAGEAATRALEIANAVESSAAQVRAIAPRLTEISTEIARIARDTNGAAGATREHARLASGLVGEADGADATSEVMRKVARSVAEQVESVRALLGRFRT
jgi:methyl-accepting chemotaxis protein